MSRISGLNHLPNCYANHASLQHAKTFKLCMESFLAVPRSAVVDGVISYGGSTGVGLNLPRKVYGEFFERNHFFTSVPLHSKKSLAEIEPRSLQDKLRSLCLKDNDAHPFSWTTVYNLFNNAPADYFYNAISLNGMARDLPYLSFTDSCACASHPIKEQALYGSLMEFLERQSLLGSWLSKTYVYAIAPQLLKDISPYPDLVEKFLENGELHIFKNNNDLPGHTVILFYFSHCDRDIVQYSIGSKTGLSLREAINGAFEELYQCYTFLYNMESSINQLENKAGSGYHLSFQQYNTQATKKRIPFLREEKNTVIHTLDDLNSVKTFRFEELLTELAAFSSDIYYYHAYEPALQLHMTKIVSPDFFAHMSLTQAINYDNLYAKKLGITKENAYLETSPFP